MEEDSGLVTVSAHSIGLTCEATSGDWQDQPRDLWDTTVTATITEPLGHDASRLLFGSGVPMVAVVPDGSDIAMTGELSTVEIWGDGSSELTFEHAKLVPVAELGPSFLRIEGPCDAMGG